MASNEYTNGLKELVNYLKMYNYTNMQLPISVSNKIGQSSVYETYYHGGEKKEFVKINKFQSPVRRNRNDQRIFEDD